MTIENKIWNDIIDEKWESAHQSKVGREIVPEIYDIISIVNFENVLLGIRGMVSEQLRDEHDVVKRRKR